MKKRMSWKPLAIIAGIGVLFFLRGCIADSRDRIELAGRGLINAGDEPAGSEFPGGWTSLAAGNFHGAAVGADGSLWTWGANEHGPLGDGTRVSRDTPFRMGGDSDWAFVAAGGLSTFAIRKDGSLWAWGRNRHWQLGCGSPISGQPP